MQIACGQKNNRIYALTSDIGKKEKMVWTNNNGSLTSGKNKNALQKLVLIFNSRLTLVHHHIWKKNQRIFPKTISTLKAYFLFMLLYNNLPSWVFSSASFTIRRMEKKRRKEQKRTAFWFSQKRTELRKLKYPPSDHPLLQFLEGQYGLQQQKGANNYQNTRTSKRYFSFLDGKRLSLYIYLPVEEKETNRTI